MFEIMLGRSRRSVAKKNEFPIIGIGSTKDFDIEKEISRQKVIQISFVSIPVECDYSTVLAFFFFFGFFVVLFLFLQKEL